MTQIDCPNCHGRGGWEDENFVTCLKCKGSGKVVSSLTMDIEEWAKREHPNGVIDWKKEHERLLGVLLQVMPQVRGHALINLCQLAIDCGDYLHRMDEPCTESITIVTDTGGCTSQEKTEQS